MKGNMTYDTSPAHVCRTERMSEGRREGPGLQLLCNQYRRSIGGASLLSLCRRNWRPNGVLTASFPAIHVSEGGRRLTASYFICSAFLTRQ